MAPASASRPPSDDASRVGHESGPEPEGADEQSQPPTNDSLEKLGPVRIERLTKEDGRALILYSTSPGDQRP